MTKKAIEVTPDLRRVEMALLFVARVTRNKENHINKHIDTIVKCTEEFKPP